MVIAYILVIMTLAGDGPRITMQEFGTQDACVAEKGRIDNTLRSISDRTTMTRCSPKQ